MIKIATLLMAFDLFLVGPEFQLTEVRKLFYKASESRKVADEFEDKMKNVSEKDPVLLGYKGMANMLQANYSFNPVNKITYFNRGKELLERSIKLSPNNVELRFLRFSVQTNAPSFLGYRSKIAEDKRVVIEDLIKADGDDDLEHRMKQFLLSSKYCTDKEKNTIQ